MAILCIAGEFGGLWSGVGGNKPRFLYVYGHFL